MSTTRSLWETSPSYNNEIYQIYQNSSRLRNGAAQIAEFRGVRDRSSCQFDFATHGLGGFLFGAQEAISTWKIHLGMLISRISLSYKI